jgi:hypothetical protein
MTKVTVADWMKETVASCIYYSLKGIKDPRGFIFENRNTSNVFGILYRTHAPLLFRGLMEYGMSLRLPREEGRVNVV